MSLNFGFSLPALLPHGGGGFDPFNQSGPTLDLVFAGTASEMLSGGYTLNTNFIVPQYEIAAQYSVWENGVGMTGKSFSDIVTFTRASSATYFDSTGTLQTASTNVARFDYDPSTLALRGLLIEEQRTNSIRNNTMQGAVAGTPGTAPTNWTVASPSGGLTREIVGIGTESGITYIDVRYSGTASATSFTINFDTSTQIAATNGQTWAISLWLKTISGSADSYTARISLRDGTGASLGVIDTTVVPTVTLTRFSGAGTLANASVAYVQPQLRYGLTIGNTYDITLRIGLPQLEQGAFATSVIPTTTTATTRSADVASITTLSPWFNAAAGTLFAEYQTYSASVAQIAVALMDSSGSSNRATVGQSTTAYNGAMVDGGAVQASLTQGTSSTNVVKNAFAFAINDFAFSVNGAAPATDTSGTVSSAFTEMQLGKRGSASPLSGYLRRITYYPRRMPNAQLQTITT